MKTRYIYINNFRTNYRLDNGTTIKYENYTDLIPCTLDRFQNIFTNYDVDFTD